MYYPALNQLYQFLRRAHKHVLKSLSLHSALSSPPSVAFEIQKQLETN